MREDGCGLFFAAGPEVGDDAALQRDVRAFLEPDAATPDLAAQFVLELIAGNADTIGIVEGDRVTWERKDAP